MNTSVLNHPSHPNSPICNPSSSTTPLDTNTNKIHPPRPSPLLGPSALCSEERQAGGTPAVPMSIGGVFFLLTLLGGFVLRVPGL